jgi:hypothetical protein
MTEDAGVPLADDFLFHGDGRALRGGRLAPSRSWRTSIFSSVMVRLRVLRCMPSSRAARHWLPLFSCEHGQDETFLELTHALGIKNIAAVHLQDKCFQLIFHDAFLSLL